LASDSIDLQDRDAPSAQNHSRVVAQLQPNSATKPAAVKSPLGSHQAETLREVAAETAEDLRSPRASWTNGDGADLQQYAEDLSAGVATSVTSEAESQSGGTLEVQGATHSQRDNLAIAQNGGHPGQEASDDGDADADADADGDGDMDDDMMDKISSSPSIEDGGYPRASPAFLRSDS
jgi:hypothetical protein